MLISVDFWKSMHGFAMNSRTRDTSTCSNYLKKRYGLERSAPTEKIPMDKNIVLDIY